MVVTGRLTIPTADGDLLNYSAVASEPLGSASKAPAAEVAASSCLRRAAALAGLGLELCQRKKQGATPALDPLEHYPILTLAMSKQEIKGESTISQKEICRS